MIVPPSPPPTSLNTPAIPENTHVAIRGASPRHTRAPPGCPPAFAPYYRGRVGDCFPAPPCGVASFRPAKVTGFWGGFSGISTSACAKQGHLRHQSPPSLPRFYGVKRISRQAPRTTSKSSAAAPARRYGRRFRPTTASRCTNSCEACGARRPKCWSPAAATNRGWNRPAATVCRSADWTARSDGNTAKRSSRISG